MDFVDFFGTKHGNSGLGDRSSFMTGQNLVIDGGNCQVEYRVISYLGIILRKVLT